MPGLHQSQRRQERAFSSAPFTPRLSSPLREHTDNEDTCTYCPRGGSVAREHGTSLCTAALAVGACILGSAAPRASDFLLHVVMELEFGLIGQLHGPVFQLPAGERDTELLTLPVSGTRGKSLYQRHPRPTALARSQAKRGRHLGCGSGKHLSTWLKSR